MDLPNLFQTNLCSELEHFIELKCFIFSGKHLKKDCPLCRSLHFIHCIRCKVNGHFDFACEVNQERLTTKRIRSAQKQEIFEAGQSFDEKDLPNLFRIQKVKYGIEIGKTEKVNKRG